MFIWDIFRQHLCFMLGFYSKWNPLPPTLHHTLALHIHEREFSGIYNHTLHFNPRSILLPCRERGVTKGASCCPLHWEHNKPQHSDKEPKIRSQQSSKRGNNCNRCCFQYYQTRHTEETPLKISQGEHANFWFRFLSALESSSGKPTCP